MKMKTTTQKMQTRSCPAPHSQDAREDYQRALLEDAERDYESGKLFVGSDDQVRRMHRRARQAGAMVRSRVR